MKIKMEYMKLKKWKEKKKRKDLNYKIKKYI